MFVFMLASEIISKLEKTIFKKYFAGIFSRDNIPRNLKDKHFIILNTDIKSGVGLHWYTVVRVNDLIECFDSLGIRDDQKNFICSNFNFKGISHVTFNTTQIQPSFSTLCGQYVLFYLFERYHNLDLEFDELVNIIFSEQLSKNDETVVTFMNEFLN